MNTDKSEKEDICAGGAAQVEEAEKESKIRAWYANKPSIFEANTYYWGGFFGNGTERTKRAIAYGEEVEIWLLKVFDGAEVKRDEERIYLCGELVFSISSSRHNVYKAQDLRAIKRAVKQKTGVNLNRRMKA